MPKRFDSKKKRIKAYRLGLWAEWLAMVLLWMKGYRLLARRFKTPFGEIDIVAKQRKTIVFIEVKARRDKPTLEVIHPHQQRRWVRAAEYFLAKHPNFGMLDARFDVILISGRGVSGSSCPSGR